MITASHSRIATFHSCRRKAWYRYSKQIQLRSILAINPPQTVGKAGHATLEARAQGMEWPQAIAIGEARLQPLWDLELDAVPEKWHHLLDPAFFREVMLRFALRWEGMELEAVQPKLQQTHLKKWEGFGSEARYWVQLPQASGVLEFVPDRFYRRESDGGLGIVDYKFTTSYLKGKEIDERRSHQHRLYQIAAQQMVEGEEVVETTISFVWIGAAALSDRSKALKFSRFAMEPTEGALQETLEWFKLGNHRLEEEGEQLKKEWQWPANRGFHCRNCDYASLCDADPIKRERVMSESFEPRSHD